MLGRRLIAALALMLCATPPALAQKEVQNPGDPWVHAATGTRFPAAIGAFKRNRIIEYSEDGRDASAGYQLDRGDQWLTVTLYVYPAIADWTCRQTFDDAKASIDRYKGASVVREGLDPPPSGLGKSVAHYVQYQIPAGAIRENMGAVRSDAYLYCPPGDKWLVKYRATGSADFDFGDEVEELLRAIDWPKMLGG